MKKILLLNFMIGSTLFLGLGATTVSSYIGTSSGSVYLKSNDYINVYTSAKTQTGNFFANELRQTITATNGMSPQTFSGYKTNVLNTSNINVGMQREHHFKVTIQHELFNNTTYKTSFSHVFWTEPLK